MSSRLGQLLEHLADVSRRSSQRVARVLEPGGYSVHICSCRLAPFAIAGRILPHRSREKLLFALHPEVVGDQGFETHYDRGTPNGSRRRSSDTASRSSNNACRTGLRNTSPHSDLAFPWRAHMRRPSRGWAVTRLASYATIIAAQARRARRTSATRIPADRPRVVVLELHAGAVHGRPLQRAGRAGQSISGVVQQPTGAALEWTVDSRRGLMACSITVTSRTCSSSGRSLGLPAWPASVGARRR